MAIVVAAAASAQDDKDRIRVSGSVQSDVLLPQNDEKTGARKTSGDLLTNTYADVNATSKYVDAGLRFQYTEHPLPGYENDFKG